MRKVILSLVLAVATFGAIGLTPSTAVSGAPFVPPRG